MFVHLRQLSPFFRGWVVARDYCVFGNLWGAILSACLVIIVFWAPLVFICCGSQLSAPDGTIKLRSRS